MFTCSLADASFDDRPYVNLKMTAATVIVLLQHVSCVKDDDKRLKSNYFIVRPKVDQTAGLLSLPHLGNFRRTATFTTCALTS